MTESSGTPVPAVLQLGKLDDGRFDAPHPADDPEGRNVVFSGQIMAQMIMAAAASVDHGQDVKSIHTVFSRAGTYDHPMTLELDTTHSGRTFGSTTVTAWQNDRLLSRGMVLLNSYEDDLTRHGPDMPAVIPPEDLDPAGSSSAFPGCEVRMIDDATEQGPDGTPSMSFWVRAPETHDLVAVNQAINVWAQPGELIGLAIRPHTDVIDISDAHVSISTGVIAHTTHFHERFDVGSWLLVRQTATAMGHGRVYGEGRVFDRDGRLVSTFSQDSMTKRPDRPLDPNRSM